MCIRDSSRLLHIDHFRHFLARTIDSSSTDGQKIDGAAGSFCLLYTSDAADERSSVDLGGRRIIKKKKKQLMEGIGVL